MILLDRVTKVYGKTHIALDRISLHVEPKEFVIIVGPSGAGKSTLLKLLTREERQSSGKIIVGGLDYENLRDRSIPTLRRRIGVVFQDFKLLPSKTVFENVAFALEIVGMSNQEIQHTVPRVLEIVGLQGKAHLEAGSLSYGQRKLLELAYIMVADPDVILLDEPAGGVNPTLINEIGEKIRMLNERGKTFLIVEHNMEFVMSTCDSVTVMTQGRDLVSGKPNDVRSNPAVLEAYLGGAS